MRDIMVAQGANQFESHRDGPTKTSRVVLVLVMLIIAIVLFMDLSDVQTSSQEILPAAPYALAVLVAAYFLEPRLVAATTAAAVGAQTLVGWNHESPFWLTVIEIGELALIGVLCVILSARIRLEAGLKTEAEVNYLRFRGVFEGMSEGVIIFESDGRIFSMNPPALKLFGYGNEEDVVGKPFLEIGMEVELRDSDGQVVPAEKGPIHRMLRNEELSGLELEVRRPRDGTNSIVQFQGKIVQSKVGSGGLGVLTIQEVTETRYAQNQLLFHERTLAALEEREKLARELHDNLGNTLSYFVAEGQAVRVLMDRGEHSAAGEYLDRSVAAARAAISDLRDYLSALKPKRQSAGLFVAVGGLLKGMEASQGIRTELVIAPGLNEGMIGSADRIQLHRIVQEALANVRKHALANSARVVFERDGDHLQVVVEDDGKGFDKNTVPGQPVAFGLAIMRERAEERGGSLRVETSPGSGSRIIVRLPLAKREANGNGSESSTGENPDS